MEGERLRIFTKPTIGDQLLKFRTPLFSNHPTKKGREKIKIEKYGSRDQRPLLSWSNLIVPFKADGCDWRGTNSNVACIDMPIKAFEPLFDLNLSGEGDIDMG